MLRQIGRDAEISLVTAMDIVSLINTPLDVEPTEHEILEASELLAVMAVCVEAPRRLVLRAVRVIVRRIVRRLHAARCDLGDAASILALRVPSKRLDPSRRFSFVGAA
jgi:hypothetical protein